MILLLYSLNFSLMILQHSIYLHYTTILATPTSPRSNAMQITD